MDKKPLKVKIGPFDYTIRWYLRDEENRDSRYGYTDNNELEIGISDRLPAAKKADTFIHEVMHAYWYVLNMKDRIGEEETVSRLGIGMTMFARDNPDIVRWWINLTCEAKPLKNPA